MRQALAGMTTDELHTESRAAYEEWRTSLAICNAARNMGEVDREIDAGVRAQRAQERMDAIGLVIAGRQSVGVQR